QSNIRIRWSFKGTSDTSLWALDNMAVNTNASIETNVEWTEGIGDPNEDPLIKEENDVTVTIVPDTPGVHYYGATALINSCRTYDEDGTSLVEIRVSYPYAGEDIIFTNSECGQNTVQLNAYDNTLSANENIVKGAYP